MGGGESGSGSGAEETVLIRDRGCLSRCTVPGISCNLKRRDGERWDRGGGAGGVMTFVEVLGGTPCTPTPLILPPCLTINSPQLLLCRGQVLGDEH